MSFSFEKFTKTVDDFRELAREFPSFLENCSLQNADLDKLTEDQKRTVKNMMHIMLRGCYTKKDDA